MEQIDVAIIGAGVSGLAAAMSIARRGRSVCVLDRHRKPGLDTSTHNSGVIHAGLYYPRNTLKTRLAIEGRPLLYEFCRERRVPHAQCGKLVVAADEADIAGLDTLYANAQANGVADLAIVDRTFIRRREPSI